MKSSENILVLLLAIVSLLGFGGVVYVAFTYLSSKFGLLNANTSAIIIITTITFLLGALIIALAIRSLRKGLNKSLYPEKAVLYTRFLESWYIEDTQERYHRLRSLKEHMLIWATEEVLEEYLSLYDILQSQTSAVEIQDQVQKVLVAIRSDLGNDTNRIEADKIKNLLSKKN